MAVITQPLGNQMRDPAFSFQLILDTH